MRLDAMNGVGAGIQAGEMVAIGVLALSFHMWRIFWVSFRTLQDVFHHDLSRDSTRKPSTRFMGGLDHSTHPALILEQAQRVLDVIRR